MKNEEAAKEVNCCFCGEPICPDYNGRRVNRSLSYCDLCVDCEDEIVSNELKMEEMRKRK